MATSLEAGERRRWWWSRRDALEIFGIWAVFTVLLIIFSLTVPRALMGEPASTTMRAVETTFIVFTVAASPVAALVWAIALYSLLRWRRKGDWTPDLDDDGDAIRGNRTAVGLWIGVSSALCLFLLVWGLAAMQAAATPTSARNPLVVEVTGNQWVWTFKYPGEGGGIETNQLYLPIHRDVVFKVTSDDVIHSFWVVEMGIKVDANPGQITTTETTPERIGVFNVRCAELCGLLHADMETTANVVTPAQFNTWVQAHQAASQASAQGSAP